MERVRRGKEKDRPIRWTMMMLVAERTNNGVRLAELNDGWLDGLSPAGSEGTKEYL